MEIGMQLLKRPSDALG
jgi:ribonuclease HI